jgi:hypothetical protein
LAKAGDQKQLDHQPSGSAVSPARSTAHGSSHAMLLEQALARAEAAGLTVTRAEIEYNIGNLRLLQGRYDCALDYLERSRRRYFEALCYD